LELGKTELSLGREKLVLGNAN
jgi:hypothetical protein